MVDMGQHFVLLVLERRSDHDEDHRARAPRFLVNFLDVRAQRHLVAWPYRRDELDILARVKTAAAEARHVLEEMPPVAEGHGERRRRDDSAVRTFLRRFLVSVDWVGLA